MTVELISVGTELLLGNIVNTNAAYLSEKCALLGLSMFHQSVIGDNPERMKECIQEAVDRSDIVILTGGLGPTKDDLTKEMAAEVFGRELYMDEHSRERIEEFFRLRKSKVVTENNWKQAMMPEGAIVIDNDNGTAPGIIMEQDGKRIILMPGPPNEMKPMFDKDIAPYLNRLQPEGIYSRMIKVCGIGESRAETMVHDLMDAQSNPTLAPYAKTAEVHFRITAKAVSEEAAEALMEPMTEEMQRRFGDMIYTMDEHVTLEEAVVELLKERGQTVSAAESCTGGLLAGRITNVPGASTVFQESHVTYANEVKEHVLGVKHETLEAHGAVSEETACEMAEGARRISGSDFALGITGIAGPDGGTDEKPVGLVYIACASENGTACKQFYFNGNRAKVRDYAVTNALILLRKQILSKNV
jgi:nicotinamide-nucleotide amidase